VVLDSRLLARRISGEWYGRAAGFEEPEWAKAGGTETGSGVLILAMLSRPWTLPWPRLYGLSSSELTRSGVAANSLTKFFAGFVPLIAD
jgi:hypothetical protein